MNVKLEKADLDRIWKEYKMTNSIQLRDKLITHYLFVVKQTTQRLAVKLPKHVRIDDMYATGIMGLIKAVERFDISMKNKFETYASILVRGAIIDEMRSLDWVPRSIHKKANIISQSQQKLQQQLGRDPTDSELAADMDISISELQTLIISVRPAILISLDDVANSNEDDIPIAERIADNKTKTSYEIADRNEFARLLREAVMALPDKERVVLVLYYYENLMLKEIGQVMNVSESRVSQIHTKAVLRMRARLKDFISEFSSML